MPQQNKDIKIAIIATSLAGGGAEKVAVNLANHYASIGYKIDLVLFKAKGDYIQQVSGLVTIINLNIRFIRYYSLLSASIRVRKYLIKNKPSAVLSVSKSSNISVGFAAIGLKNQHIVLREAGPLRDVLSGFWPYSFIYLTAMRLAYCRANKVIANSQGTMADLLENRIANREKIVIISNPVLNKDFLDLSAEPIDNELFNDKKLKVIISIGRLDPEKNYPLLVKAFKMVFQKDPNTRLMILGQGKEKCSLLKLIEKLNLHDVVIIEDFKQNIYPYINQARVFALASNWEGFGNVIVEALALGKPVVCTNCPGGPAYILDGGRYGSLVPMNNDQLLADAIIRSLDVKVDIRMLKKRAQDFSVEYIAQEYLNIIMPQ